MHAGEKAAEQKRRDKQREDKLKRERGYQLFVNTRDWAKFNKKLGVAAVKHSQDPCLFIWDSYLKSLHNAELSNVMLAMCECPTVDVAGIFNHSCTHDAKWCSNVPRWTLLCYRHPKAAAALLGRYDRRYVKISSRESRRKDLLDA